MFLFQKDKIELKRQSNNFDFLRLLGAFLVIVAHCQFLIAGKSPEIDYFKLLFGKDPGRLGVVIFFVISGFLVTKSWITKKNFSSFFLSRVLRIYPGAIVVIILTVFILGPVFTEFSIANYFNHELSQKYLYNLKLYQVDFYQLPGVFQTNPHAAVNGSLWTIPHELACYVAVMLLGTLSIFKNRFVALFFGILLIFLWILIPSQIDQFILPYWELDFNHFYGLFLYFYMGSLLYLWKDYLIFNWTLGLMSILLLIILNQLSIPTYYAVLLIPYSILCIAFTPKIPFHKSGKYGDFSYGLYIYAFPVQQMLLYFFHPEINVLSFILLTTFCTLVLAYFSWHFVEKPSLSLRNKFHSKSA
ncbi:MAG: acyltransferase [Bacteroidota bacterium]